jgi:hypothetical protein
VGASRLAARDGSPLRMGRALVLSASWAFGAGAGVALGAILTSLSGAGAPGVSGLDVTSELVVIPWIAAGAVLVAHFCGTLLVAAVRGRRSREGPPGEEQRGEDRSQPGVDGQVGAEVPPAQA